MDHMGSSEFLTSDVTQRITSWTSYDEWGNITHNAVLKCGERELDLVKTYTGHERDSVLGMYYAKARMYDTADKHGSTKANKLGDKRFTAVDPVKGDVRNPQTMVQYTYVINNPLMYTDPLGEYYIKADVSGKYTSYKAIPETKAIAAVKILSGLDPSGIITPLAISEIERYLNLMDGSSKSKDIYFDIAMDVYAGELTDAIEKSAEEFKKGLGKKLGIVFLVNGLASDAAKRYSILASDEIIFTLGEATNLVAKRYALKPLSEEFAKAHEYVAKNNPYFFGRFYVKLSCSPGIVYANNSLWEDDYDIFLERENREKLLQHKISNFIAKIKATLHGGQLNLYSEIEIRNAYAEFLNDAVARVTLAKSQLIQKINTK